MLGKDDVTMVVVKEKEGKRRIATKKRWSKDFHLCKIVQFKNKGYGLDYDGGVESCCPPNSAEGRGRNHAVLLPRPGNRFHLEVSA